MTHFSGVDDKSNFILYCYLCPEFSLLLQMLQAAQEVRLKAKLEKKEYEQLMGWLDECSPLLRIAEVPITDMNKEYEVCSDMYRWHYCLKELRYQKFACEI